MTSEPDKVFNELSDLKKICEEKEKTFDQKNRFDAMGYNISN